MVSIKDVAREAGVSVTTVSRVINNSGYVGEDKRKLIESTIEKLGYRPSVVARSLVYSQTKTIGVCVPFLNTPFFASLVDGIESEAENYGYDLLICHSKENAKAEMKSLQRLMDRKVDGLILIPVDTDTKKIDSIINGVPTVITMRALALSAPYNTVYANDYQGTIQVFEKLVEKGHRNIGFIRSEQDYSTMHERWRAVEDMCEKFNIELKQEFIETCSLDFESGQKAASRLLDKRSDITALFCTHYWGCAGVLKEAYRRNINIPNELSVASFDIFDDWSIAVPQQITGNIYPSYDMGQEVFRNLLYQIQHPGSKKRHMILDLELNQADSIRVI